MSKITEVPPLQDLAAHSIDNINAKKPSRTVKEKTDPSKKSIEEALRELYEEDDLTYAPQYKQPSKQKGKVLHKRA